MKYVTIDRFELEKYVSLGYNSQKIKELTGFSIASIRRRLKEFGLKIQQKRYHTDETKKLQSEIRKKWLADNPDKHPWRSKDRFRSVPCQVLKDALKNNNVNFIEEFQPALEQNRFFSIDIAIPEKMIGIEVNGNQHYERDGTLKPYYLERSNFIKQLGWSLIEIHYSLVYNKEFVNELVSKIINSNKIIDFDLSCYVQDRPRFRKPKKIYFCSCGKEKRRGSITCRPCFYKKCGWVEKNKDETIVGDLEIEIVNENIKIPRVRKEKVLKYDICQCGRKKLAESITCRSCTPRVKKIVWPSKEVLKEELWKFPTTVLAKKYGVSDVAISKWAKSYDISKPPRGYWNKLYANKLT